MTREDTDPAPAPPRSVPAEEMDRGAEEMQRRLAEARERLRRDIPPPPE